MVGTIAHAAIQPVQCTSALLWQGCETTAHARTALLPSPAALQGWRNEVRFGVKLVSVVVLGSLVGSKGAKRKEGWMLREMEEDAVVGWAEKEILITTIRQ